MAHQCAALATTGGRCGHPVARAGADCGRHTKRPAAAATLPAALALAAEDPFGPPKDDGGLRPDGTPWPTVVDVDGNTWTRRPPSRLSPSAFNDWRSCQRGFAFDRIQRRPSEPGLPATIGVHVHRVLDLVMELPAQERTLERALGIHEGLNTKLWEACRRLQAGEDAKDVVGDRDNRDEDIRHAVEVVVLRPGLRAWNDAVERGVRGYFAMASPEKVEVIATEQKFEQKWEMRDSGLIVPITGSADRLDRLPAEYGGGIRVIDYKNGKVISPKFDKGEHDDQILTYAAMVEEDTGELPAAGLLLYVSHQKPKHVEVTPEKVADVKDRIGRAWADIHDRFEDDSYEPNPGPLCGWCPHIRECDSGQAEARMRAARGTGRGGLREDAPARTLLPDLALTAA